MERVVVMEVDVAGGCVVPVVDGLGSDFAISRFAFWWMMGMMLL